MLKFLFGVSAQQLDYSEKVFRSWLLQLKVLFPSFFILKIYLCNLFLSFLLLFFPSFFATVVKVLRIYVLNHSSFRVDCSWLLIILLYFLYCVQVITCVNTNDLSLVYFFIICFNWMQRNIVFLHVCNNTALHTKLQWIFLFPVNYQKPQRCCN